MKRIKVPDYPFTIRHLTLEEGGGYFIEYPDLPGCISDGETIEETITNGQDAVACWIVAAKASHHSNQCISEALSFTSQTFLIQIR